MVHVDYFLHCMKLECGGIFIAWVHIIYYLITLISWIVGLILIDRVPLRNDIVIIVSPFLIIACIAIIVVAYRSIRAIKTRNHKIMLEMVGTVFAIASLWLYTFFIQLWLFPISSPPSLIIFGINFYLFIVVYSLYRVFRKEYEHRLEQQLKASKV